MKVIQIEHDRCNEPDKYQYYFVPDEMTEDQIRVAIAAAQTAYLKHVDEMDLMFVDPKGPGHQLKDYPDNITIGEAKAQREAHEKAVAELQKKRWAVESSFSDVLKTHGIKISTEVPEEMRFTADWGHRHGKTLRY